MSSDRQMWVYFDHYKSTAPLISLYLNLTNAEFLKNLFEATLILYNQHLITLLMNFMEYLALYGSLGSIPSQVQSS